MTPKKNPPDALSIADTGINTSVETLSNIFKALTDGVQAQLDAESEEQKADAALATKNALGDALTMRDQLIEYRGAIEAREQRIRRTVAAAESVARRYASFVKNLDSSIYQYMAEQGIDRIEGDLHRFALHKQPDELQVTDQTVLPPKYFTFEKWWNVLKVCHRFVLEYRLGDVTVDVDALEVAIDMVLAGEAPATLNKALLIEDLNAGIEIPGAFILKGRTRLSVK